MMTSYELPTDSVAQAAVAFGPRLDLAVRYAELLATTGIEWGLLGPREAGILWPRHLLNSAGLAGLVHEGERVADIGSGAGLPGIPLALARPDVVVELVEPMQRRVDFLTLAVADLGLGDQVRVVRARAEEYDGRPSAVVCRAVASVRALMGLVSHLVPPARLLALKGQRAGAEVDDARELLHRAGLRVAIESATIGSGIVGRVVVVEASRDS